MQSLDSSPDNLSQLDPNHLITVDTGKCIIAEPQDKNISHKMDVMSMIKFLK